MSRIVSVLPYPFAQDVFVNVEISSGLANTQPMFAH